MLLECVFILSVNDLYCVLFVSVCLTCSASTSMMYSYSYSGGAASPLRGRWRVSASANYWLLFAGAPENTMSLGS